MTDVYPLAGVRVLDLTRLLPGGFCTLMLADLGADVVKVEDPHGGDYSRRSPPWVTPSVDPHPPSPSPRAGEEGADFHQDSPTPDTRHPTPQMGAVYAALNRGKRSVIIDLKEMADRELFLQLVDRADVVVEGFRPGVMDRLGVGSQMLLARNPRLVYASLTGYGQTGPLAATVGHDINYIGTAGLLDLNGPPQGPLVVPGAQLADLSGAMVVALGILAALVRRATTGQGGSVDTSMTEAALALLSLPLAEVAGAGKAPSRGGHSLSGGWACYNVYQAGDSRNLALGCLEPKFWANFCQAVERPEWVAQQFDASFQPGLKAAVAGVLATRPATAWLARVAGRDIPLTLVNPLADVPYDPQMLARGVFMATAYGQVARTPIRIDELPPAATSSPPGYGEHSAISILDDWSV